MDQQGVAAGQRGQGGKRQGREGRQEGDRWSSAPVRWGRCRDQSEYKTPHWVRAIHSLGKAEEIRILEISSSSYYYYLQEPLLPFASWLLLQRALPTPIYSLGKAEKMRIFGFSSSLPPLPPSYFSPFPQTIYWYSLGKAEKMRILGFSSSSMILSTSRVSARCLEWNRNHI